MIKKIRYFLGTKRLLLEQKLLSRPLIIKSLLNQSHIKYELIQEFKIPSPLKYNLPNNSNLQPDPFFENLSQVELYDKYLVKIQNAKIKTADGLLIFPNGDYSLEHVHHFIDYLENCPSYIRTYQKKYTALNGNWYCIIGFRPGAHYHMIADFSCRIIRDLPFLPDECNFLVPWNTSNVIKDALIAIGISGKKIITAKKDVNYIFENLYWSPPSTKSGFNLPIEIKLVKETILNNLLKQKKINNTDDKHIYVSRNDAKRKVINENELFEKVLDKFNFKRVCLSQLTFAEQVNIFYNANMIIAPHGAGLVNLIFCKSDTKVIELFPDQFLKGGTCYWAISECLRLDYTYLKGKASFQPYYEADLWVDPDKLLSLICINQ
jgi:hypothetical protein